MDATKTLSEIEGGIETAEKAVPMLQGILTMLPPPFNMIAPFLNLLPTAAEAVMKIQAARGVTQSQAIRVVADHNTPNAPNAPELN
jgi:hypothetical protein